MDSLCSKLMCLSKPVKVTYNSDDSNNTVQYLMGENLKVVWAKFSTFKLGRFTL